MQEIDKGAFSTCSALSKVTFNGTLAQWNAIKIGEHNEKVREAKLTINSKPSTSLKYGPLSYSISSGAVTITDCDPEAAGVIVIPDLIENCPVKYIGKEAFAYAMGVTEVVLPQNLRRIYDRAFYYCGIEKLVIPNSVVEIGREAFRGCPNLKDVVVGTGITEISFCAFDKCTKLENITIPDHVTAIKMQAFAECHA